MCNILCDGCGSQTRGNNNGNNGMVSWLELGCNLVATWLELGWNLRARPLPSPLNPLDTILQRFLLAIGPCYWSWLLVLATTHGYWVLATNIVLTYRSWLQVLAAGFCYWPWLHVSLFINLATVHPHTPARAADCYGGGLGKGGVPQSRLQR